MTLESMFKVEYTKINLFYALLRDLFLHFDGLFITDTMISYGMQMATKNGITNINLGVKFSPRVFIFGTIVSYDV